jgi:hypothetical protein
VEEGADPLTIDIESAGVKEEEDNIIEAIVIAG